MKKIISILILSIGCFAAKAQTPKILISYDENGNRNLREYVVNRPAPDEQPQNNAGSLAEATTGLVAANGDDLKVYPNPSNDNFNVTVSQGILNSNAVLILLDQLGREQQRTKIASATTTISTRGMADGVYNIIVQYGNTRSTIKITKVAN